jgi:hypothetical protein
MLEVQVGVGHILFTLYLGVAMTLTAMSLRYYVLRPEKYKYPLLDAIRFGATWPVTAPIAHTLMLHKWYKERTYRKWRKIVLEKRRVAATQKHS